MEQRKWNEEYWDERWRNRQTGWDIGYASPPITDYVDSLDDKSLHILIPGCGNAYEGEYLLEKGFSNTFLIDLSETALKSLKKRVPEFPDSRLIHGDFFAHEGDYDLIIEQTFFCALDPALRRKYAEKMHALLKPGGKLVGLLFDDPLNEDHPPFGGNREEYITYFEDLFEILHFETAENSIVPRLGRELFIELRKPENQGTGT